MSTIWEMAQIIRAEDAAALAAKSEAPQHASVHAKDGLKAPAQNAPGMQSTLRSLVTRLVHRKAGPAL